ncbi:MAG: cytochrome c oxidase subunit 3 [Bacteroidota bacterium]
MKQKKPNQYNSNMSDHYSSTEQGEQSFAFHPYNVLLILTLFSITALFLAFSVSYMYSRIETNVPPVELPAIFIFNTLILIGSSGTMAWANRSYRRDETKNYQLALGATIALSLIFMVAQYIGWSQLFQQEIFINHSTTASYLYLISFMHFLHIIAGLPFLVLFLRTAYLRMKEPVSVLVYFSDPEKRLKLRLLTIYWHFLDALWIYLVFFFWINYLIY